MDYLIKNTTKKQRTKIIKKALAISMSGADIPTDETLRITKEYFPLDFDIILDNLTRQIGDNGKITRYSIRDKFVLAALDKKDYPEPEHLQFLLKHSIVSGISKKVERLSSQLKSPKEEGER